MEINRKTEVEMKRTEKNSISEEPLCCLRETGGPREAAPVGH